MTRKWARVAIEPQEMQMVAQPPEAKVSGVAKPPPWAAELPQPWTCGSAGHVRMCLFSTCPQTFQLAAY